MVAVTVRPDACIPAADLLARAFRFLGKRWNAVVLGHLSAGPAGFMELSRAIDGISDSVLSDRLADLAKGGLNTRTGDEGRPQSMASRGRPCVSVASTRNREARAYFATLVSASETTK